MGAEKKKQLERQTDGETGRKRDRQSKDSQRGGRHTWGRQTNKQLERQTDGETGRQRERVKRQTDRGQTYMGADKETNS